jgi:hypothetical protein
VEEELIVVILVSVLGAVAPRTDEVLVSVFVHAHHIKTDGEERHLVITHTKTARF